MGWDATLSLVAYPLLDCFSFSELFYGSVPGQAAVIHNAVAEATG